MSVPGASCLALYPWLYPLPSPSLDFHVHFHILLSRLYNATQIKSMVIKLDSRTLATRMDRVGACHQGAGSGFASTAPQSLLPKAFWWSINLLSPYLPPPLTAPLSLFPLRVHVGCLLLYVIARLCAPHCCLASDVAVSSA